MPMCVVPLTACLSYNCLQQLFLFLSLFPRELTRRQPLVGRVRSVTRLIRRVPGIRWTTTTTTTTGGANKREPHVLERQLLYTSGELLPLPSPCALSTRESVLALMLLAWCATVKSCQCSSVSLGESGIQLTAYHVQQSPKSSRQLHNDRFVSHRKNGVMLEVIFGIVPEGFVVES